jgi:hypothetical protein
MFDPILPVYSPMVGARAHAGDATFLPDRGFRKTTRPKVAVVRAAAAHCKHQSTKVPKSLSPCLVCVWLSLVVLGLPVMPLMTCTACVMSQLLGEKAQDASRLMNGLWLHKNHAP